MSSEKWTEHDHKIYADGLTAGYRHGWREGMQEMMDYCMLYFKNESPDVIMSALAKFKREAEKNRGFYD